MSVLYSFVVQGSQGKLQSLQLQQYHELASSSSVASALIVGRADAITSCVQADEPDRTPSDPSPDLISEISPHSVVTPRCIESSSESECAVSVKTALLLGELPYSTAVECSFGGKICFHPLVARRES
jgi:hypothetical protein